MALGDEHPYKDTFAQKRVHFEEMRSRNDKALCIATVFVGIAWAFFFTTVAYNEGLFRNVPFSWELSSFYP
jgi:hypothetical protein